MKAKEELFSFLQTEYQDLAELAASIERSVYADPHVVLVKARLFGEKFAKLVTKQEDINEVFDVKQADRIHKLFRLQVINDDIRNALDWLRVQGNKAAHETEYGTVELSLNAHRILYDLSSWLFEVYGDLDFKAPAYRLPIMERAGSIDKDEISALISQVLKSTLENTLMPSIQSTIRQMQEEVMRSSIASTVMQVENVKEIVQEAKNTKQFEVEAPKQIKIEDFDLIEYLKENKVEPIDKRDAGGALWIVGGWGLNKILFPLKERGIYFKFTPKGSGATKKKPGWFLLGKKETSTENEPNEIKQVNQVVESQIIIPAYLMQTKLEVYASGPVTELIGLCGIHYFKEINDEHLRTIYAKDQQKFYDIITHLWFLGSRFTGKLAGLLTLNHEENTITLHTAKPLSGEIRELLPASMAERFLHYGIHHISQLNHIPVPSLQWLMNAHYEEVFAKLKPYFYEDEQVIEEVEELEAEQEQVNSATPEVTVKQVCFSGEYVVITPEKSAFPINYETFKGCNKLVWYLQKNGMETIGDLPTELQAFEGMKGIGTNYLRKFFAELVRIVADGKMDASLFIKQETATADPSEGKRISFEQQYVDLPNTILDVKMDVRDFLTCPLLISRLAFNKLDTYGQLPGNLVELTRMPSVGKGVVAKFFEHLKLKLEKWHEEQLELERTSLIPQDELENHYFQQFATSIEDMITSDTICQQLDIEPRTLDILLERFQSVQNGKRFTLEECGQKYGLTRERIRQIIKKTVLKIALRGNNWIAMLKERLEEQKGFVLNQVLGSENFSDHLIIEALENEGIYLFYGRNVFSTVSKAELAALEKELDSWLDRQCNGRLLDETQLNEMLSLRSNETGITAEVIRFIVEQFFTQTASGQFILANYSKVDLVTIVMLQYPEGVEIYKNASELLDKGNQIVPHSFQKDRDFNSVVTRDEQSDKFYLWGRGVYIHHSFVQPDMDVLEKVAKEIALQLENQRTISVGGVYRIFEAELKERNIPNEYALYTLLRMHFSTYFTVPKFPKITRFGDTGSLRNSDLIKEYIREQGTHVTRKQLFAEFVVNKGWKSFTLEINLSTDSEIIQVDHGSYGLIEFYAHLDESSLKQISNKIEKLLIYNTSIDVKRVFDEMESECLSLHINTPYLLYSLLREYCQEQFSCPRAPHIVQKGMEEEEISFTSLIENYLLDRGEVVSREEILYWLTEEIGTSSFKLEMALRESTKIFYYTRGQQGEYIHEDVLGWNDPFKERLHLCINEMLDRAYISFVKPFVIIEEELKSEFLPELTGELHWSRDLLLDCLKRDERFLLLGSKGHIVLKRKNPSFIESNTDFIAYVLRKEFGGSAPEAKLRRKLREYAFSHHGDLLQETEALMDSGAAPFGLVDGVFKIYLKPLNNP
ncbi:sigma factor-like helix-turn-helix DNA-binding protein [Paenibacillus andongensis]|uniref:sigma factor-like helix-turn-helix DNA-binding protein n=1 Tax=Paenibacillus andongensis TaxID=2975482 RepID=UPI0021BA9B85|nr:sigma factor-like helix-turn-helix DNA-binding protein [Paenibacillus andongensis]